MPAGVVVLDERLVHQLYFVTIGGRRSGPSPSLAPRTGVQAVAHAAEPRIESDRYRRQSGRGDASRRSRSPGLARRGILDRRCRARPQGSDSRAWNNRSARRAPTLDLVVRLTSPVRCSRPGIFRRPVSRDVVETGLTRPPYCPQTPSHRTLHNAFAEASRLLGAARRPHARCSRGSGAQYFAQSSQPASTLTLDEAISIARQNNPLYLTTANERKSADAQVRQAYGALLPSSNAQFYRLPAGRPNLRATASRSLAGRLRISSQSQYYLGLNYRLNAADARAASGGAGESHAADADITGAAEMLRSTVTQQYITALAPKRAPVSRTRSFRCSVRISSSRRPVAVGADNISTVRRAEVTLGQAEVRRSRSTIRRSVEKVRALSADGRAAERNVKLTTQFAIATPTFLARFGAWISRAA